MDGNVFVVVGDSFAAFAKRTNVMTVSQLLQWLDAGDMFSGTERIVIGQGIDEATRQSLSSMLASSGVECVSSIDNLASLALTHKRSSAAVLITEPRPLGPRCYEFDFALNDRQDRLSDHVTGQHMGAMLLMEAARQATVASIEREWIIAQSQAHGFILEAFNASFSNYAFPLPMTLRVSMEERERSDSQIRVALTIDFFQSGKNVSEIHLDVRLLQSDVLERIEMRRASQALEAVLRQHQSPQPAALAAA